MKTLLGFTIGLLFATVTFCGWRYERLKDITAAAHTAGAATSAQCAWAEKINIRNNHLYPRDGCLLIKGESNWAGTMLTPRNHYIPHNPFFRDFYALIPSPISSAKTQYWGFDCTVDPCAMMQQGHCMITCLDGATEHWTRPSLDDPWDITLGPFSDRCPACQQHPDAILEGGCTFIPTQIGRLP